MMPSFILLYLKGIAMGAADAVPGVSGGTIAFISGIYEELILSIRSFDRRAAALLSRWDFAAFWRHVHGTFLAVLLAGIATSILIFSRVILFWLGRYPVLVWAFFFGLIVASILAVGRRIGARSPAVLGLGGLGVLLGYYITVAVPAQTPETLGFVFLSGMIAICAMILPGISGSFILVLLSKYEYIFTAIRDFNLSVIAVFGCGCGIGILSFSHLLNWTLRRWHAPTIAMLTGLMIGSLNKVWPWKIVVETYVTSHGKVKPLLWQNTLPAGYLESTGLPPYTAAALLAAFVGFMLVYLLERLSARMPAGPSIRQRYSRSVGDLPLEEIEEGPRQG
jgi:putative membrane protein